MNRALDGAARCGRRDPGAALGGHRPIRAHPHARHHLARVGDFGGDGLPPHPVLFGVDVLSSLLSHPRGLLGSIGASNIGRHCFSDYAEVVGAAMRPNPFEPYPMFPSGIVAADQVPGGWHDAAAVVRASREMAGRARLGLIGYLLALTIAVLSPAIWAARGARGLERVVVFVALGAAAIPAWAVIDRGNWAGFMVPIALVFLVALRRQRWGLVAIMVVLAALVEPQYAVLTVVLFAVRQWRMGGLALAGVAISNIAAYLLWPQDFPKTITQSIRNLFDVVSSYPGLTDLRNVSFGRAALLVPDYVKRYQTGELPPYSFLAGPRQLIGYAVLFLVVVFVLALGRRIPPVMVGIVLLTTAALSPPWPCSITWYSFCQSLRSSSETPTDRLMLGYSTGW